MNAAEDVKDAARAASRKVHDAIDKQSTDKDDKKSAGKDKAD